MATDERNLSVLTARLVIELSRINVTKPYKPRKLKKDPEHTLKRKAYEIEHRDPSEKMKDKKYRIKYERENRQALKKRREFVRQEKKRKGIK